MERPSLTGGYLIRHKVTSFNDTKRHRRESNLMGFLQLQRAVGRVTIGEVAASRRWRWRTVEGKVLGFWFGVEKEICAFGL